MHLCPNCQYECDCDREPERWLLAVVNCKCPCEDERLDFYDSDYEDAVWGYFAYRGEMDEQGLAIL